jgi:hypothetical protein
LLFCVWSEFFIKLSLSTISPKPVDKEGAESGKKNKKKPKKNSRKRKIMLMEYMHKYLSSYNDKLVL